MHNVRKNTLQDLKKNIFSLLLIKKFGQENGKTQECCLKKPYGITELQNLNNYRMLYFIQMCVIRRLFQKWLFSTQNGSGSTRKT